MCVIQDELNQPNAVTTEESKTAVSSSWADSSRIALSRSIDSENSSGIIRPKHNYSFNTCSVIERNKEQQERYTQQQQSILTYI